MTSGAVTRPQGMAQVSRSDDQAWRNEFRGGEPGLGGPYGKGPQAPKENIPLDPPLPGGGGGLRSEIFKTSLLFPCNSLK